MKKIIFKRIKMKGIPFLLLVISLLTARPVFGQTHNPASLQASTNQETPHFSLQQILTRIETNNPGLQQFALKTKSSFALGEASRAWMAPSIGLGMSEFPYGSVSKINNGMMPRKMLMLRLQQMFPNFSKQKAEQKYEQSFANQNKDDRGTMKNRLFAQAKMAYYDAFIAQKKLSVIEEQEKKLQLLIQVAEGRLAYNKASLPNIYKARAKLSDLQSMQIKLHSTSKQSIAILNSLMNRPVNAALSIDTSNHFQKGQINILQVDSAYVLKNRTDILHTGDAIHTLNLKQKMVGQASKPTFGITLDNMRMPGFENNGMYTFSVMATMSIPIAPWFSKGYKSKVNAMDYQIQAMQKMKENQIITALGNIQKDWLNLQSAKKDLKIFKEEVLPAYAKTYQSYLNAFSENTGDIYETLSAWDDLTMKRMEYYDKLGGLLNIKILLETELQVRK